MAFGRLIQGLAGNFSEQSKEALTKEFGQYLLENEEIQSGYKLIRDSIIFTNIRIIFTDKQGATGRKMSITMNFLILTNLNFQRKQISYLYTLICLN